MKLFLKNLCPCCGGSVYVTNRGYHCSMCDFHIPGYICNRHISQSEADDIIGGERIILDGFSKDNGAIFSSIPVISGNTVMLDNTVYRCNREQNEEKARVIVGRRFFKCERNSTCHSHCPFARKNNFRRTIDGHMVTVDDINTLIKQGELIMETFTENGEITYKEIHYSRNKQRPVMATA